ncbi:MAG: hypothetical protein IH571_00940, partial [Acholeplasmataceae bacterium]|nr:hypothetical protein [Acholeplasmataceae bacterium]
MFDNFIWIILSIIVLSIWIGHMTFVLSLAKEKGDIGYKKYLIGLIPYFGVKYYV